MDDVPVPNQYWFPVVAFDVVVPSISVSLSVAFVDWSKLAWARYSSCNIEFGNPIYRLPL